MKIRVIGPIRIIFVYMYKNSEFRDVLLREIKANLF